MIELLSALATGLGLVLLYDVLAGPLILRPWPGDLPLGQAFFRAAGLDGLTTASFGALSLGLGVVSALVAHVTLGWPVVDLAACAIASVAPFWLVRERRTRRRQAVHAALVEALGQLRDAVRAGRGVQEALGSLADTGPELLRPEFRRLGRELELRGLDAALVELRERLADPALDMAVLALRLNDRLGSRQTGEVLDRLVGATRAELRVRAELDARAARGVLAARIVVAVPVLMLVILRLANPIFAAAFDDAPGQLVLAVGALLLAAGYLAMRALLRAPEAPRLARSDARDGAR